MNLNNEPERLKEEEQLALNKLIAEMDEVINVLDEHMKTYVEEAKNIDISINPDTYLARLLNVKGLKNTKENRKKICGCGSECKGAGFCIVPVSDRALFLAVKPVFRSLPEELWK